MSSASCAVDEHPHVVIAEEGEVLTALEGKPVASFRREVEVVQVWVPSVRAVFLCS